MSSELEQLQAENDRLKAELVKAENEQLKAKLEALSTAPKPVVERGMTTPREIKTIIIPHQDDPKTHEKITATVRTDHGYDPHQKFFGRQP